MEKNHKDIGAYLYEELKKYSCKGFYPFHMPGHKRLLSMGPASDFPNPYGIDITEIEGFDNLHHAEGIIKASMNWAASVYGADYTYYLVNGSSSGILSAISAAADVSSTSGTILMSRNCHKAVYHGVFLNRLKSRYVYPHFSEEYGIQCGLSPLKTEKMLKRFHDISLVFVVSPTYDGIVSDIGTIADICHSYGVPLIVDEAHGAHFRYSDIFPVSALELGADVVIQSVHKTLPCFTQSAILHLKGDYVNKERVERFLQIYQSSSPSYVLMAGIEEGIRWMEEEGREKMEVYSNELLKLRKELGNMRNLRLLGKEVVGTKDIFDLDISKIIVSVKGTKINGLQLQERLRREYHLEMEMCTEDYVTGITTVMDTIEGLSRLKESLLAIDSKLEKNGVKELFHKEAAWTWETEQVLTIYEAWEGEKESILLEKSQGRVGAEFIYLYPPGIPIIVPGERITEKIIDTVLRYKKMGLSVQGLKDKTNNMVEVVRNGKINCDRGK